MPRERKTKGVSDAKATSATTASRKAQAPTETASELQLVSQSNTTWEETKQSRSRWDTHMARAEYQYAAKTLGAPAVLGGVRDMLLQTAAELTDLRISFERQNTLYNWGNLLGLVNGSPFQLYLVSQETSPTIVESGSDPVVPTAYSVGGQQGVWGNVVLQLIDVGYSSRYGGSFCAVLVPSENCGIELLDRAQNLALDLHEWVLRLYVQPSLTVFNSASIPASVYVPLMHCELDIMRSEAYQLNGLLPLPTSVTQGDIDALVAEGESQAAARLEKLARFLYGWVHHVNVPTFSRTLQRVDRIHVSDSLCHLELSDKAPVIQVELNIGYLFESEGLFDGERELTARPWLLLRTPPLVVLSSSKKRYIGNSRNTGWMTMGYLAPDDFKTVHEITLFPGWTESDPLFDDEGGGVGTVMSVNPDGALIDQRVNAQQPGKIGDELFALENDPVLDWTSYSIEVRFKLTWL